jgi:sugar phosphate isomerase/epimerase
MNRRENLGMLGTGLLAMAGSTVLGAKKAEKPLCFFTKMFQSLTYHELAALSAELGFAGVEATIRPKGHIEPATVPDELPKLVAALKKQGREVTIMASGINAVSKTQHTESVLRTAAALGIKHYRMSYLKYDLSKPLKPQLVEFKAQLKDLVALNKELGIQALYQNHAGKNLVGAPIWDICDLIEDLPREAISLAFDIRHAVVEAGMAWRVNASRAMPLAGAVYVKDFVWEGSHPQNVPLGTGRVGRTFFKEFGIAKFDGPISLHVEYVPKKDKAIVEKGRAAYATDLKTLRSFLG